MGQPYAQRIYLFQPETKQSDEPFQWFLGSNIVTLLNRYVKGLHLHSQENSF